MTSCGFSVSPPRSLLRLRQKMRAYGGMASTKWPNRASRSVVIQPLGRPSVGHGRA